MRSTFSQVSPRPELFFDSSDFLRLSGVSAAARHRLGSASLLRTDLMRKKDPFSQIKMWKISLIPLAQLFLSDADDRSLSQNVSIFYNLTVTEE